MQMRMVRTGFHTNVTAGVLYIDGYHFCHTLEDIVRLPGIKIMGKTAIPDGHYKVRVTWSPRFRVNMPLLIGDETFSKGWSGVRIHAGNCHTDTEGCILVGKRLIQTERGWELRTSRLIYLDLLELLVKHKEDVALEICNGVV